MANKKKVSTTKDTTKPDNKEILINDIAEDAIKQGIPVDTTDETKTAKEFIKAKSANDKPIYYIRTDWANKATQKASLTDVNAAIKECNKYPSYKVFDENKNIVHYSIADRKTSNNAVAYAGKRYDIGKAKLFANAYTENAIAMASGVYYLYDAKLINGRYRVVNKKENVSKGLKYITGYIAIEELL